MSSPQNTDTSQIIKDVLALIETKTGLAPKVDCVGKLPSQQIESSVALLNKFFVKEDAKLKKDPVRTVHHLSCTGGTLIAKCIAALPNILMLNEVDPLSSIPFNDGQARFTPTDMVALLRQGDTRPSVETIVGMFTQQVALLRDESALIGRSLVIRDHSHSQFLVGDAVPERPTVREMLCDVVPVRSIVTVRDPVDSYLSLQRHGWHKHFSPPTFKEYCRRCLIFLDKYKEVDIIRYEDFVAKPEETMQKICGALDLDYSKKFTDLFGAFQFSGDSGRSGDVIKPRAKRVQREVVGVVCVSQEYKELALRTGYSVDRAAIIE